MITETDLFKVRHNKVLYVGDCHATVDALEEMKALIEYIIQVCKDNGCFCVVFMGDQFHTHATVNVYVMEFWRWAFKRLVQAEIAAIALVGNHDIPGNVEAKTANAMRVFEDNCLVVDEAMQVAGLAGITFMPYYPDKQRFIEESRNFINDNVLVCHQTFDGAQFENGFYAEDGVDMDLVYQGTVISGHIHLQAKLGKVHYVGSPRWRTVSDANQEKAIWLYTHHGESGKVLEVQSFSTHEICNPIYSYRWSEGEERPELPKRGKVTVDLVGTEQWVRQQEQTLSNVSTRRFVSIAELRARESDGLALAFKKYVDTFQFLNGTDPSVVWAAISSKVSWLNHG